MTDRRRPLRDQRVPPAALPTKPPRGCPTRGHCQPRAHGQWLRPDHGATERDGRQRQQAPEAPVTDTYRPAPAPPSLPRGGREPDRFDRLVYVGSRKPARYLPEVCKGVDYFVPEFFQELK